MVSVIVPLLYTLVITSCLVVEMILEMTNSV